MRPGADVTSDEELLREIARGRHDAVGELYARHAGAIFGMASQTFDPATAEEIVQDVFVAAWRGAASFDASRGGARPWLFAIARHRISNELRRRSRHPGDAPGTDEDAVAELRDPAPAPDDALWRRRRGEILRAALSRLPEGERAAIGLAYFEDLPHGAIASLLRVPLGTAKSRLRSGVARLRLGVGPLVAMLLVGILATLFVRQRTGRGDLARDERALEMLTSSDAVALRLSAAPAVPPEAHATFRFRPGSPTAVVTLSHFPAAAAGEADRAWARIRGRWILLGEGVPDAAGHARFIAENDALGMPPERLAVTLESGPAGAEPGGRTMAAWEPDRK
jgi:RNA polymerase sigma-70 factor (ECF subfamily)